MWTFTWPDVIDIPEAAKRWHRFISDHDGFCKAFPYTSGLRVFEQHPGSDPFEPDLSHGLHVHAVVPDRLPVDIVRSIWLRKGGGRLNVKYVPAEKAMYIGKYLSKQRIESLKGVRLWAPFGLCEANKVKDIVVDSRWTSTYQFLAAAVHGFKEMRWDQRARIVTRFCMGESFQDAFASIGMEEAWDEDAEARHDHLHGVKEVDAHGHLHHT
jgi:hypothetical protein